MMVHFSGRYEILFVNSKTGLPLTAAQKKRLAPQYDRLARERGWERGVPFIHNGVFVLLTDKRERDQDSSWMAAKSYLKELRKLLEKHRKAFSFLDHKKSNINALPPQYEKDRYDLQALFAKDLKLKTLTV